MPTFRHFQLAGPVYAFAALLPYAALLGVKLFHSVAHGEFWDSIERCRGQSHFDQHLGQIVGMAMIEIFQIVLFTAVATIASLLLLAIAFLLRAARRRLAPLE